MLEWFRCPDREITPVKDCLTKCRMTERCETIPYLHLAAAEREWTGEASTTQLLNGTMYTYLKIKRPYVIDPDDMAFAIHGTKSHEQLEVMANKLGIPSELSTTSNDRNVVDLIEFEDGIITLTDYKTWGSFKVAKTLGIVEVGKKPDPTGATYSRSGAWGKAGSAKMITEFGQMVSEADNYESELQLNRYRIKLEKYHLAIDKMRNHIIVRDGGLAVARSRGITRNTYIVPVKKLEDDYVLAYFAQKENELKAALDNNCWATPCNNRECWDGVRCRDYCEVAVYCTKGILELGGKQ